MDAQPTIADEVERYLRTGETDPHLAAWPGGSDDFADPPAWDESDSP